MTESSSRVPAWAVIGVLAVPAALVASAWTTSQLESSPACAGDAPHASCTVDGGFAATVVAVVSVVAIVVALIARRSVARAWAEWLVAVVWLAVVTVYLALPVGG